MERRPEWLKRSFSPDGTRRAVEALLGELQLTTVCESALCPNLLECWGLRQLTFMILGERCSRSCRFCAVPSGRPQPVDPDEPARLAEAVSRLGLRHVVITSVARDDLQDEGTGHFVAVAAAVRARNPGVTIELLVPDFHGRPELVGRVLEEARPDVFAHNIETVERLSLRIRPQAAYRRSLAVLRMAASAAGQRLVKSGLMLGLGETEAEVIHTMQELHEAGVTHMTIGQYLQPSRRQASVVEYVSPDRFERCEQLAYQAGMRWVKSGPFVRSSYHAIDALEPSHAGKTR